MHILLNIVMSISRFDFLVIGAATLALIIKTFHESCKYKFCSFA